MDICRAHPRPKIQGEVTSPSRPNREKWKTRGRSDFNNRLEHDLFLNELNHGSFCFVLLCPYSLCRSLTDIDCSLPLTTLLYKDEKKDRGYQPNKASSIIFLLFIRRYP